MEKKSSIKEVHKLVPQDYPELYKKISGILGDENPFAKFSIGAGNYIWSDNRCDWHQMIAWSSLKQEAVKEALANVRSQLITKFGEKQAELLLSIPDDGYIYFNDDEDEIKILITGWGFKKPVRVGGKPIIEEILDKNPITIAFVYNGSRLPNYQFGIKLSNKARKLHTDADGLCHMGNLCEGEKYIVYDILNGNKTYNLEIVSGQSHYDIDLTKHTQLSISALADEQSVANEQIDIQYHNSSYNVTTDANGNAVLEIPLYEGEQLSAILRDQTRYVTINSEGNHIDFVFKTTPPPAPTPETDVVVTVFLDGSVLPNKNVRITYNGQTYTGITNENGRVSQHLQIIKDETCDVSVEDYASQQRKLEDVASNEFRFEKSTPVNKVIPKVIVRRENGENISNYPITVEVDGKSNNYVTGEDGVVILPEVIENSILTVTDGNDISHKEEYTITLENDECIFIIPNEEPIVEPVVEQQLKLMFRDKEGKPIVCNGVNFHQDGREDVHAVLDEKGDTYIPKGTFKNGEKVTVSINGWEDKYAPIPFVPQENEDEYLIQEKDAKNSWWMIVLQILVVLSAIVAVIALWPFLEAACAGLYEGIYNTVCPYF